MYKERREDSDFCLDCVVLFYLEKVTDDVGSNSRVISTKRKYKERAQRSVIKHFVKEISGISDESEDIISRLPR